MRSSRPSFCPNDRRHAIDESLTQVVRTEQPDSGSPRVINQSATLGFSTPLEYRNTRCETFVPYLRGQEDLFNDVFSGAGGLFVYEELPAARRKAGITGRGLEGLLDVVLRPFGV